MKAGFSDMDVSNRIGNADPATILNTIKNSNYGDHNLVVYPYLGQFEEFHVECCKDSVLQENGIFILVTYHQQVSTIRKKIHLAGIDVATHEND